MIAFTGVANAHHMDAELSAGRCGDYSELQQSLKDKRGQLPTGITAVDNYKNFAELYANPQDGSWSVLESSPHPDDTGTSCVTRDGPNGYPSVLQQTDWYQKLFTNHANGKYEFGACRPLANLQNRFFSGYGKNPARITGKLQTTCPGILKSMPILKMEAGQL